MKLDNGDVLFTCGLLGLDQASCIVDADNEAASDLWVEGAAVARLAHLENLFGPGHDFVRTRI